MRLHLSHSLVILLVLISQVALASDELKQERDSLHSRLVELAEAPAEDRAAVCYNLGYNFTEEYKFDSALVWFNSALELYREAKDLDQIYKCLFNLAYIHYQMYEYDKALEYFHQSMDEVAEVRDDDSLRAVILDWISLQYLYSGAYEEAIKDQLQSIKIREEQNDSAGLAESYYSMGDIFNYQKKIEESHQYFNKCINLAERFNQYHLIYGALGSIGGLYLEDSKWDSAYVYSRRALKLAEAEGIEYGIANSSSALGNYHLEMEGYDSARYFFERAAEIAQRMGEAGEIANAHLGLGRVCHAEGQTDLALGHFKESLRISHQYELNDVLEEVFEKVSKYFYDIEMYDSAFLYQEKLAALKNSLFQERNESTISTLEARYSILQHESAQQQLLLKKDKQIEQMTMWGAITMLLLVLALTWTLYHNYRNQKQTNAILELNNSMIRAQNDKLLMYNEDLKQFAYATSHDLRQPLRTIGSFASLIERKLATEINEDTRIYFEFINRAVNDMSALLTNLLSYSQLDDKSMSYEDLNLNEILSSVTNNLTSLIQDKGANILIEEMPGIHANREHMMLLFQNLTNNGLKFNEKDNPEIQISWYRKKGKLHFTVQDNGLGIEKEYTERIFGLFQRLHDKSQYHGSGMGLAICKRIVKHYRGEIWVDSRKGEGSTFHFVLPEAKAMQAAV